MTDRVEEATRLINKFNTKKYVYFIQCGKGGPIKIGLTDNPRNRLAALQTGSPWKYILLRVVSDVSGLPSNAQHYEQWAHKEFERYRLDGEWFEPVQKLLDFIKDPVSDNWPRWAAVNIEDLPPRMKGKTKPSKPKKPTSRDLWEQILEEYSGIPVEKIRTIGY